jgi:CHASE3 domain sensor protein
MAFRTMEEVIAVAEQRENPELYFRNGMAQRAWSDGTSRELVAEWLRRHEKHAAVTALQAAQQATERTVRANEAAAVAAQKSARWAGWAVVISVIALAVAALPLITK